jgi:hypothetical protein
MSFSPIHAHPFPDKSNANLSRSPLNVHIDYDNRKKTSFVQLLVGVYVTKIFIFFLVKVFKIRTAFISVLLAQRFVRLEKI